MLACCLCGSSYPRPVAPRLCILIIFYALCPCWIVLSWLCVVHLCSGRTLINSQKVCLYVTGYSRGRSDLRIYTAETARSNHNTSLPHHLFFFTTFLQNIISLFLSSSPFFVLIFSLLSLCVFLSLPSRLRFQNWWVTTELPCCFHIPHCHP